MNATEAITAVQTELAVKDGVIHELAAKIREFERRNKALEDRISAFLGVQKKFVENTALLLRERDLAIERAMAVGATIESQSVEPQPEIAPAPEPVSFQPSGIDCGSLSD
jgi:hypothetical protein